MSSDEEYNKYGFKKIDAVKLKVNNIDDDYSRYNKKANESFVNQELNFIDGFKIYNVDYFNDHLRTFAYNYPQMKALNDLAMQQDLYYKIISDAKNRINNNDKKEKSLPFIGSNTMVQSPNIFYPKIEMNRQQPDIRDLVKKTVDMSVNEAKQNMLHDPKYISALIKAGADKAMETFQPEEQKTYWQLLAEAVIPSYRDNSVDGEVYKF